MRAAADAAIAAREAARGDCVTIDALPILAGVLGPDLAQAVLIFDYWSYVRFIGRLDRCEPPDVELVLDHAGQHAFVLVSHAAFVAVLPFADVIGDIDHGHYLACHPDVAASVAEGRLGSAREHYVFQGYLERRAVRLVQGGR